MLSENKLRHYCNHFNNLIIKIFVYDNFSDEIFLFAIVIYLITLEVSRKWEENATNAIFA